MPTMQWWFAVAGAILQHWPWRRGLGELLSDLFLLLVEFLLNLIQPSSLFLFSQANPFLKFDSFLFMLLERHQMLRLRFFLRSMQVIHSCSIRFLGALQLLLKFLLKPSNLLSIRFRDIDFQRGSFCASSCLWRLLLRNCCRRRLNRYLLILGHC